MPPGKLDSSILLALGLASMACGDKEEDTGPCLDVPVDTGDTGPCLDYGIEQHPPPADAARTLAPPPPAAGLVDRAGVTEQVLARGVLPEDVAKLLRRGED